MASEAIVGGVKIASDFSLLPRAEMIADWPTIARLAAISLVDVG